MKVDEPTDDAESQRFKDRFHDVAVVLCSWPGQSTIKPFCIPGAYLQLESSRSLLRLGEVDMRLDIAIHFGIFVVFGVLSLSLPLPSYSYSWFLLLCTPVHKPHP